MKKLCTTPKRGSNSTLFKATPPYIVSIHIKHINLLCYILCYILPIYYNIIIPFKRSELACIEFLHYTLIIPLTRYKQSLQAKYKAMLVIALPVKAEKCKPTLYIYYI